MNIINLTPHEINEVEKGMCYPPSGKVARISINYAVIAGRSVGGAKVRAATYGNITDLPPPKKHTLYIVSGVVLEKSGRTDLIAPGELIRDYKGVVIGCREWKGIA